MNDTTTLPTDWFQYYHQQTTAPATPSIAAGGHSNTTGGTIVTTSFTSNNNISSPNNSTTSIINAPHAHLNPQATLAKPMRRRSRNSQRTSTTLLKASTANFRSLVQQFTGCQNTKTSLNFQKGPVNLTFGKSSSQNIELGTASSRVAPLGFGYYNQQPITPAQLQHQQQDEEMLYPKQHENMKGSTLHDFVIDDISAHELMDESSFHGSRKDGYIEKFVN